MVIVTRLTADPDFEKNNAFRGATTQSWGLPEGLGIPDFRDGNGISISTDYYHGLIADGIAEIIATTKMPEGIDAIVRGSVEAMRSSLRSFSLGLSLSVVLLFLVLVAQFRSFVDPFLILLAFPPGIAGALLTLWLTHTPLNVMSLMGLVMLAGITMSNSILIVEFAHHLVKEGHAIDEAVTTSCAVRLRPILMTTLATIIGLLPMALKMGEGSESYAPLAMALVGGLGLSVVVTMFVVPAGFYLAYRK